MVVIRASMCSFRQGSSGSLSRVDERPVFTSSFSADYCIDTTEVTLGDYLSVMNRLPSQYGASMDGDLRLPVCFVTWFDAVLYCN